MIPLLALTALAAPPVPTWSARDVGYVDEVEDEPAELEAAPVASTPSAGVTSFDPPRPTGHGWADEASLTFDVSGQAGRFYYVMATARGGGLVAHWRQGPIAGEDLTRTFELEVPPELPELVEQVGQAYLSLTLAVVDSHDRDIGRTRLGTTWLSASEGVLVGAQPEPQLDDTAPDEPADLAQGGAL